ncbi:MAG: hypothetical protein CFH07_00874 [Alphaproteobacteria bacterium MarineAlpha3_Bin6]|nr:MAG: hypothetical protein CFH07_00874 [Alphaproteobacteria bacterium MarineAlpha3_Bin6]
MIRLPVIKTVFGAYYYLWEERLYLWQLTLPPLVVLAILKTLVQWGTVSSIDIGSKIASIDIYRSGWVAVLFYVAFFVNIWVWLSYSVAWHRAYLLRSENKDVLKAYSWNGRQVQFLWTTLKIFFLMVPAMYILPRFIILGANGALPLIIGMTACLYVYARLLLWFPAVAIDQTLNIWPLWQLSGKNGWRLASVMVCTSLPLVMSGLPVVFIFHQLGFFDQSNQSLSVSLLGNLFLEFLSFIALAASISALSFSYRYLLQNKNSPSGSI